VQGKYSVYEDGVYFTHLTWAIPWFKHQVIGKTFFVEGDINSQQVQAEFRSLWDYLNSRSLSVIVDFIVEGKILETNRKERLKQAKEAERSEHSESA
jgi:hypothetical protein